MPHGNKKPQRSNKKKKNKQNRTASAAGARPAAAGTSINQNQTGNRNDEQLKREDFPTWDDPESFAAASSSSSEGQPAFQQTIYTRYKQSTRRFKDALKSKVPANLFANDTANDLMDAVDYLAENTPDIAIEQEMMRDLKIAIISRKKVQEVYTDKGEGDQGHEHFLIVLSYCFGKLRSFTRKKSETSYTNRRQPASGVEATNQTGTEINRFASLSLTEEESDDDDDDDETGLPPVPTTRPSVVTRLSLTELIHGTDRMDATFFLMSLDELMMYTADQFKDLKKAYRTGKQQGYPPLTIIEQLMEATVASNFGIQMVASLEQQLVADHPHMSTIYRVLAVMVMPQLTEELTNTVTQQSPLSAQFKETHAIEFLGDALECGFRNKSDPNNQSDSLASEFATRWQIPQTLPDDLMVLTTMMVMMEAPMMQERANDNNFIQLVSTEAGVLPSHSWLSESDFIGRDRSIIMTMRLLQGIGSPIRKHSGMLELKQGYFGRQWDEKRKKAAKTQGDLDEFLMGDVLPLLVQMCTMGLLSSDLPRERELLTFFSELKTFVRNPLQPVSWSLAFAVHALLTSVIEVQGSDDVHNIGREARNCFEAYMSQIDWVISNANESARPKHWHTNMQRLYKLSWLVRPLHTSQTDATAKEVRTLRALWNPLCAGSFLLYLSYFVNIEVGTSMIDSFAQLRVVLHLFNAFLKVGAFAPGQVELLDWLHGQFKTCKAVWEGSIPEHGQFVFRWWIAHGMNTEAARQKSNKTRARVLQSGLPFKVEDTRMSGDTTRRMTPIQPEELAKSYRRICLRDFSGMQDLYHTAEQRRRQKHKALYQHAVRMNDTLDAMEVDQRLLATNIASLGEALNRFFVSLFGLLELESVVQKIVRDTPASVKRSRRSDGRRISSDSWEASDDNFERNVMIELFVKEILGPLDFAEQPLTNQRVARTATFIQMFFSGLNPEKVMFFVPVEKKA